MIDDERNQRLPFAASCVRLSHKPEARGRFLEVQQPALKRNHSVTCRYAIFFPNWFLCVLYTQATADILAGTVLISEPAFAAVVSADFDMSRCHHCFVYRAVEDLIV